MGNHGEIQHVGWKSVGSKGLIPHTSVSLTSCISIVFNILTCLTTMLCVGSLKNRFGFSDLYHSFSTADDTIYKYCSIL